MKPFTSCLAYFSMLISNINLHVGVSIIDALTDEILHGVCTIKAFLSFSLEAESGN